MQAIRRAKNWATDKAAAGLRAYRMGKAHARAGNITPSDLISAFVAILIGLALFPAVNQFVTDVNATGIEATLVNLIPLLYVVGVVVGSIGFLGLRRGM